VQTSGTTNNLYEVCFTDANNGTAVGSWGTILRTTNGGANWVTQTSGTTIGLFGICFTDVNTGTTVGPFGTILCTTNGGANWIVQTSGTTNNLSGVYFTDMNTGIAVGDTGTILRTTNGGASWITQTSGTTKDLFGVSFTDANNGTAVGWDGTILRTTNGGATFVEEEEIDEVPTEFLLSNNYPNPFNPSTKIKYQIPASLNPSKGGTLVILKVYDILGKEIETLVNEEKPVGTYEVNWYAKQLPSGVYFYQLKAGEFLQTKKMLLIK
jgi:photosystem II stability/assembly factor-like uncharacterized protein